MMDDLTIRFSGETPYQAIVNHKGLTIEEENDFLTYLVGRQIDAKLLVLEQLEVLYDEWQIRLQT